MDKIIKSKKDAEIFFKAIVFPKKPNKTLKELAEKYKLIKAAISKPN